LLKITVLLAILFLPLWVNLFEICFEFGLVIVIIPPYFGPYFNRRKHKHTSVRNLRDIVLRSKDSHYQGLP
jgi:hypothetical protein